MFERNAILAGLTACTAIPGIAAAQEGTEAKPPYTLSANVSLVSDYYFRGLTQTWHKPAIQGGFDFAHDSGFYAGTWASNVSGAQYPGASLELDLYGGYNHKLNDAVTIGGGLIYYWYPNGSTSKAAVPSTTPEKFDTLEAYFNASWKWLGFKASYALSDYFGANQNTGYKGDTDGTIYLDLTANYPLPFGEGFTLVGHIGYTIFSEEFNGTVNGESDPSYADWKLGVSKSFAGGWNVGLFYAQADNDFWENTQSASTTAVDTKDLNEPMVILQFGRTF